MRKITPSIDAVNAARSLVPAGPVVMVNFLKFKSHGGKELYAEYMQVASQYMPKTGELIYFGKAAADLCAGEDWDYVGLARYPDYKTFADFFTGPGYQNNACAMREAALERAVLMITSPATPID